MFKKLLGSTLAEIPAPIRLAIILLVIAVSVLGTIITVFWHKIGDNNTSALKEKDTQIVYWQSQATFWHAKSDIKDAKIDSMTTKAYNDKIETNNQLEKLIDNQNHQKKLLRGVK